MWHSRQHRELTSASKQNTTGEAGRHSNMSKRPLSGWIDRLPHSQPAPLLVCRWCNTHTRTFHRSEFAAALLTSPRRSISCQQDAGNTHTALGRPQTRPLRNDHCHVENSKHQVGDAGKNLAPCTVDQLIAAGKHRLATFAFLLYFSSTVLRMLTQFTQSQLFVGYRATALVWFA